MSEKNEKYIEGVDFQFFSPSPILKNCIKHYVVLSTPSHFLNNQYFYPFPNGETEMYFHLGKSQIVLKDKSKEISFKHFLVGLFGLTNNSLIKSQTDDLFYQCIVIPINTCFINNLIDTPLYKLKNTILDIEDLWGNKGKELKCIIDESIDISKILLYIDKFLVKKHSIIIDDKAKRINKILNYCLRKEGKLTVEDLVNETRISYRTIYRIFTEELDICPKEYLKILRFNKVCKLLKSYPIIDWTELVYTCGYFDQAHFIHEFKSIMKYSPENFLDRSKGKFQLSHPFSFDIKMADFYNI